MTPPVSGGVPEPLNDQADDLLRDLVEYGHLGADFTKRATAILEALAALKYSDVAALERPRPALTSDATTYPRLEPLRNEDMPDREWTDLEWVRNQWYLADEHWKEVQADYDGALKEIAQLEQNVQDARAALPAEQAPPEPSADDPGRTLDLILIAGTEERFGEEPDLDRWREIVESWTPEQRDQVENFCGAIHLRASDNDDVIVPSRPVILDQLRGARTALPDGDANG